VLSDGNCYILHHKVIIIDARTVITGSYNFTGSAEKYNDENLVSWTTPIWRAYLDEFERVYEQAQAPTRCRQTFATSWLALFRMKRDQRVGDGGDLLRQLLGSNHALRPRLGRCIP
jgi:phosphatidylserine/phosphatidylglycerophosphate/cardiolipin synthase-like enzyme